MGAAEYKIKRKGRAPEKRRGLSRHRSRSNVADTPPHRHRSRYTPRPRWSAGTAHRRRWHARGRQIGRRRKPPTARQSNRRYRAPRSPTWAAARIRPSPSRSGKPRRRRRTKCRRPPRSPATARRRRRVHRGDGERCRLHKRPHMARRSPDTLRCCNDRRSRAARHRQA